MITEIRATTPITNSQINNINKKSYKNVSQQDSKAQISYTGANAIANYNQATLINKPSKKVIEPSIPTILQPEAIKTLKGDRIYSSTGTLDSIITKDDKTTTVYKMDASAPQDAIRRIETFDNKTGKLIRTQENLNIIEKNKLPKTYIIEILDYSTDFPKPLKTTVYYKGQLEMVSEHEYGPNNYTKSSVVQNKEQPMVEENFQDQGIRKTTKFDSQGNMLNVNYVNSNDGSEKTIYYKNGLPSKIINKSKSPIANPTGINPQNDATIKPSLPFVLNYNPMALTGERSFYSNGMLEGIKTPTSNNGSYVLHKFGINGNLEGIMDMSDPNNKKTILFFPKYYTIEEYTPDNIRKTTIFNDDGTKEVSLFDENNNIQKCANYFENGNIAYYLELLPNGDKTLMNYDKNGNLINIS